MQPICNGVGCPMRPLAAVLGGLLAGAITSFVMSRVRLWGDE